jgi:glycosyltransferase involved in cell wall biosynthesis
MQSSLVSVVIPAYNAQEYIEEAIKSVLAQTYQNWEIIVVNDGSTDNTAAVVQQFGDAIHYIYQPNRGLSAARNAAILDARAEIIALLDADDLWETEFLEKMVVHLQQHQEAAAVYCGFRYIDAQGQVVGYPQIKTVPPESFYETLICKGNWLVPCSVVFRKRLAEEAGIFDESLRASEDADLWARLSVSYPFIGVPEALVRYRRHDSNMTKDPERMVNANYQRTEKMFGPPEGDVARWPRLKRCAYVRLFRYGSARYLAAGNAKKSADYLLHLLKLEPTGALSVGIWRELARVHLPDEHKNDATAQFNWTLAQRDLFKLLDELAARAEPSSIIARQYHQIKGSAFLALAEEAVQAGHIDQAVLWLWRTATSYFPLLLARPYWGTVARSIIKRLRTQPGF